LFPPDFRICSARSNRSLGSNQGSGLNTLLWRPSAPGRHDEIGTRFHRFFVLSNDS